MYRIQSINPAQDNVSSASLTNALNNIPTAYRTRCRLSLRQSKCIKRAPVQQGGNNSEAWEAQKLQPETKAAHNYGFGFSQKDNQAGR